MYIGARRLGWIATAAAVVALAWWPAVVRAASGAEKADEPGVDDDPDVQEARERAERARSEAAAAQALLGERRDALQYVSAELDQVVESFERASEHHQRLLDERDGSRASVDAARGATEDARSAFARQVAAMYRRGPLELHLSEFVLAADSPSTALHRIGLIDRVSVGSVHRVARSARTANRVVDTDRQHEVVTVGVDASARALRRSGDELAVAMQTAEQRVRAGRAEAEAAAELAARAESSLQSTVEAAQRRIELTRIRRIAAAELAARGYQVPPVDGKACPIGGPNGFTDTWHAPRPGGRKHLGVDMFAVHGMPVYAVADGTVRVSTNRLGGLVVHLGSDDGDRYYYAHLDAVTVATGDRVAAGDIIAANGNTGNARSTPPHLHWQYHPGGGPAVNPYPLAQLLCR